jgi:sugar phosphate isomerase/epimerase
MDRREFLAAASGLILAGDGPPSATGLGVVIHSYPIRSRLEENKQFADPLRFLMFCNERGAAGVQLPLGVRDAAYTRELRATAERHGMYVEGSSSPPKDRTDVERFETEIKTAAAAGAAVVRSVMLSGRRYETFRTVEEFREFRHRSFRSLEWAAPVMARHRVRLAVENHKDYRADELADVMKQISSEFVGVCVDTGNNIALLEDPLATAQVLAPWASACHLKDMGVADAADGFLLSEVPLGDGYLDLPGIVGVLRKARPELRFSLEMITRDPLPVPCLTDSYWATLAEVPGRELAQTLRTVRRQKQPLPKVSGLSQPDQLALEEQNVVRSLAYAQTRLGL